VAHGGADNLGWFLATTVLEPMETQALVWDVDVFVPGFWKQKQQFSIFVQAFSQVIFENMFNGNFVPT
jgi:hypothetical protein